MVLVFVLTDTVVGIFGISPWLFLNLWDLSYRCDPILKLWLLIERFLLLSLTLDDLSGIPIDHWL